MNPSAHSVALSTLVEKIGLACGTNRIQQGKAGATLPTAVKLWPTPTVQDAKNDGGPSQWERNSDPLNVAVKRWPTPKGSPSGPDFARANRDGSGGDDLATAVAKDMMPTPTANRWDGLQSHGVNVVSGQLNPTWVEWLMGFPLGWTDLDASGTL